MTLNEPDLAADWVPGESVTTLTGTEVPRGEDFFVPPPAEIGRITMAASDVRGADLMWPFGVRLLVATAALIAGCLVTAGIVAWIATNVGDLPRHLPAEVYAYGSVFLLLPVIFAALYFASAVRPKWVVYVGDEGVAAYSTRGRRGSATGQWVRFDDVADAEMVRTAGRNATVRWAVDFRGPDGIARFHLDGKLEMRDRGATYYSTAYIFAGVAERAWQEWVEPEPDVGSEGP